MNLAPNQALAVGTRYSNRRLFGMCMADFGKVAYLCDGSESDVMAAIVGKVGALSKLLALWPRHSALDVESRGHYSKRRPALEMDIGGSESVNALRIRFKVIDGPVRKVPMQMLLGFIWGDPQGRFHTGTVITPGRPR